MHAATKMDEFSEKLQKGTEVLSDQKIILQISLYIEDIFQKLGQKSVIEKQLACKMLNYVKLRCPLKKGLKGLYMEVGLTAVQ